MSNKPTTRAVDKETLLKRRLSRGTVEVDGGSVTVRGLSRAEVMDLPSFQDDPAAFERTFLSLAMVDPELTEDEAQQWREAVPASKDDDLTKVVDKVMVLSGMTEDAGKEAFSSFPDES